MPTQKRYALVGAGGRCSMFLEAIYERYPEHAQLVALCDLSHTRMAFWNSEVTGRHGGAALPTYHADDFDQMIAEQTPDVVIVTTVDCHHDQYIIRAMELGCDVVTEKPMTTDEVKARAILDAVERTGRYLRVAFNYRYMPAVSKLREIVRDGAIGTPTSVDFQWYLNTRHGADYFRRWHRQMQNSGGLLVHKSTHHFDMVNFILGSYVQRVFAMGGLKFYGKQNADARGEHYDYPRYTGYVTADEDPFAISIVEDKLKGLYYDAEEETGYVRDRNVFGDDPPIDIYDTHAVTAQYRNGAILNYSLNAYCPWEGERLTINGTRGQVEYFSRGKGHIIRGQSADQLAQEQMTSEKYVRLQTMFHAPEYVDVPEGEGGHGGGDNLILDRIFLPDPPYDPLERDATHIDGAASILVGIAANRSIETGQPIALDDLLPLDLRASDLRASDLRASDLASSAQPS